MQCSLIPTMYFWINEMKKFGHGSSPAKGRIRKNREKNKLPSYTPDVHGAVADSATMYML